MSPQRCGKAAELSGLKRDKNPGLTASSPVAVLLKNAPGEHRMKNPLSEQVTLNRSSTFESPVDGDDRDLESGKVDKLP